jgi:CRP-like cAMP-binding protein
LQRALLSVGRVRRVANERWVYGAGDEDTGLCAVIEGALRIEVAVGRRRVVLVNVLTPGIVIGQSRRMGGGPRIVTARAAGDTTIWMVSDLDLHRVSERCPEAWSAVAELLYRQLADAMQQRGDLLALPARERILVRLRKLAPGGPGEWASIQATQGDVAEMTGMSRKTASAHLLALEAAGLVRLSYRRIDVRRAPGRSAQKTLRA